MGFAERKIYQRHLLGSIGRGLRRSLLSIMNFLQRYFALMVRAILPPDMPLIIWSVKTKSYFAFPSSSRACAPLLTALIMMALTLQQHFNRLSNHSLVIHDENPLRRNRLSHRLINIGLEFGRLESEKGFLPVTNKGREKEKP